MGQRVAGGGYGDLAPAHRLAAAEVLVRVPELLPRDCTDTSAATLPIPAKWWRALEESNL